jgi:hypothetical protein
VFPGLYSASWACLLLDAIRLHMCGQGFKVIPPRTGCRGRGRHGPRTVQRQHSQVVQRSLLHPAASHSLAACLLCCLLLLPSRLLLTLCPLRAWLPHCSSETY